MKKILLLMSACVMVFIQNKCFAYSIPFSDMENHWAKEIVEEMAYNKTISGYENGSFLPNKEISIAEFLKILISEENYMLNTYGNMWPDWYVNTAIDNGLICKNDFDDFLKPLLRKDAVSIISNYIGLDDVLKSKKVNFSDLSKESKDNILKLASLGVISGFQDGTFRENESVTRAQACKIIHSAYIVKNELVIKRNYRIKSKNTNINEPESGDWITENRYRIEKGRIYVNDSGRYGKLNNITLNQEFVNDSIVIKIINALVDDYSYTEVIYVPDKYTINTLNICYGQRQDYVNNGIYNFQIRFFENANYDLRRVTNIDEFSDNVFLKIELDRMWDKLSEYNNEYRASKKNLDKLQKVFSVLFGDKTAKELLVYVKEKLAYAATIPNDEFNSKIREVKKFGRYTFNILCTRDEKIQIYVQRF